VFARDFVLVGFVGFSVVISSQFSFSSSFSTLLDVFLPLLGLALLGLERGQRRHCIGIVIQATQLAQHGSSSLFFSLVLSSPSILLVLSCGSGLIL
jgi:hypothetical protein